MARAEAKYRLTADDQTARGLRSAEGRLARFGRAIRSRLGLAVAGVGTAIAGWGRAIQGSTNRLDALAKAAKDLGTSLEEAQALQLGAELQGTTLSRVLTVVERFARASAEAANNSKVFQRAFAELGLDAEAFGRLNPAAQIVAFAEALERVEPARRAALRQQIAGRGAGRLFAGDVRGAFGRAGELGLLDELPRLTNQAERTADAMTELSAVFDRLVDRITGGELAEQTARALTNALLRLQGQTAANSPRLEGRFTETERRIFRQIERNTRPGATYGPN